MTAGRGLSPSQLTGSERWTARLGVFRLSNDIYQSPCLETFFYRLRRGPMDAAQCWRCAAHCDQLQCERSSRGMVHLYESGAV